MTTSRIISAEALAEVRPFRLATFENDAEASGHGSSGLTGTRAYAEGLEAGLRKGREEARAIQNARELAAGRDLAHRLASLWGCFDEGLAHLEQELARRVLDLSVVLAEQVVRRHIQLDEQAIAAPLQEAVSALLDSAGRLRVSVNPDDLGIARAALAEIEASGRCSIVVDPSLAAGECRVESPEAAVDASLEGRWRRVCDAVGLSRVPVGAEGSASD